MGLFRDQRADGENMYFYENKHNTNDKLKRGAKRTNLSRRQRRSELGRARKKDIAKKKSWWPF